MHMYTAVNMLKVVFKHTTTDKKGKYLQNSLSIVQKLIKKSRYANPYTDHISNQLSLSYESALPADALTAHSTSF